jgi:CDP-glucose 4,6-dehydratase
VDLRAGVLEKVVSMTDQRQALKGKTAFITGDTGFKGSWLATWLMELGARVVGYALPPKTDEENYVVSGLADRIIHLDGDVRDYDALLAAVATHQPDIAFHLAAQALVLESYATPRQTFDTNVMGTVNFLEAIRHTTSVRAAVVVTSDKCYENREWEHGYRETDRLGGSDPYSASKGAAELVIASLRRSFFQGETAPLIASARAGNVIGGGDWGAHRLVPDCVRSLMASAPIEIRHPAAVRPWQHVLEALHGYLMLGAGLLSGDRTLVGAWNFGPLPQNMVPVKPLVDAVIAAWGQGESMVLPQDLPRPEETCFLHLDISKAQQQLGWSPQLSLSETVGWTIDGYRAGVTTPHELYQHRVAQIRAYEGRVHG